MTLAQPLTLETLAQRLERLEDEVQTLRAEVRPEPELIWSPQRVPLVPEEQEAVNLLVAEGLIVPPTPHMLQAAAEWEARTAEDREAVVQELRSLWLDPPLSEIIIRMRRGEDFN